MEVDLEPGEDGDLRGLGDDGVGEDAPIEGADDSLPVDGARSLLLEDALVTASVNLRQSPSSTSAILAVIPEGTVVALVSATPSNGFYNVRYNGVTGWSHANYLRAVSGGSPLPTDGVDIDGPASPANAIARARAAVGFSYYWGGGAWLEEGPTSSTQGSCSGSCPSCTHSGRYGADCSGLVAKAWQLGEKKLSVNSHPYSTASFNADASGKWSTISRSALRAGDALVYNKRGAGHIVIYEKGDGWGSPTVYECRGCSYGCVYNTRSFGADYHAIRRSGF